MTTRGKIVFNFLQKDARSKKLYKAHKNILHQHTLPKNPGFHSLLISLDLFTFHPKLKIWLPNISVSSENLVINHRLWAVPLLLSLSCVTWKKIVSKKIWDRVQDCAFHAFRILGGDFSLAVFFCIIHHTLSERGITCSLHTSKQNLLADKMC